MLFTAVSETGLAQAIHDSGPALLIVVVLRHVVVLALQGFAGSILALSRNCTNASGALNDRTEKVYSQVSLLLDGEICHDGRQWC